MKDAHLLLRGGACRGHEAVICILSSILVCVCIRHFGSTELTLESFNTGKQNENFSGFNIFKRRSEVRCVRLVVVDVELRVTRAKIWNSS